LKKFKKGATKTEPKKETAKVKEQKTKKQVVEKDQKLEGEKK